MRISILALICCLAIGCVDIKPKGGGSVPTPGPTPGPVVPDTALRRSVADSLTDVPRDECVKLYGVFTALAAYVEQGAKGIDSTGQLLQLTTRTLDNLSWSKGKYPKLAEVVKVGLNEKFKTPKPLADVRADVVATFREIAAGCQDGAMRK